MAFARPLKGRILIAGRDLSGLRLRDYRRQLGVVLQDNFLFDGTVADNVGYANPSATREAIIEACRTISSPHMAITLAGSSLGTAP